MFCTLLFQVYLTFLKKRDFSVFTLGGKISSKPALVVLLAYFQSFSNNFFILSVNFLESYCN